MDSTTQMCASVSNISKFVPANAWSGSAFEFGSTGEFIRLMHVLVWICERRSSKILKNIVGYE